MTTARFACNAVETFDLSGLPDWIRSKQREGKIAVGADVSLNVVHPDREMDGSCRWCGCRENELIVFEASRLV